MTQQVDVRIDRSSPMPLYHQLAEQLSAAVLDGTLQPGDPFENELALAERLHLSRPTVRRAIAELVDLGLVLRRRGLGTTVATRRIHRQVELSSLFDDLLRDGRAPSTVVLDHEIGENQGVALALELPADTPLLAITRLRLAGDLHLAVLHNWLPPAYSDVTIAELEHNGLYAALRARGGVPVVAHQSIGARMPTPAERRHLSIRGSRPVLTMTRQAFDGNGDPVEYGDHCYRADDYTIEIMVDDR